MSAPVSDETKPAAPAAKAKAPVPTVGRIVHYTTMDSELTRPAIVVEVQEDDALDIVVFNLHGASFVGFVPFSAEPAEGHWSWPPKA